jgi:hypothetical protein
MKAHLSSPASSFFFSEYRVKQRADVVRRASRLALGHHWLPFSATLLLVDHPILRVNRGKLLGLLDAFPSQYHRHAG